MGKEQPSFFEQIYALVAGIPAGRVMTYGQIALALGHPRAAKVVGSAMRLAPERLALPCHRVVNARGGLAPSDAFGASGLQRQLLLEEGVPFLRDGRIDLDRCLHAPARGT